MISRCYICNSRRFSLFLLWYGFCRRCYREVIRRDINRKR